MNSSEPLQPLSQYEQRLTAYLDGSMSPEDSVVFERENPDVAAMKAEHARLSSALRRHSVTPALGNGEFFNHQILRQIEPPAPAREKQPGLSLWRLVFASACCLLAALGIYSLLPAPQQPSRTMATTGSTAAPSPKYMATITKVAAGDHLLTAKLVNADGLAVVWVDGMDKLAKDYVLQ